MNTPSDDPKDYQKLFIGKSLNSFVEFMQGRFPGWHVHVADDNEVIIGTGLTVDTNAMIRAYP